MRFMSEFTMIRGEHDDAVLIKALALQIVNEAAKAAVHSAQLLSIHLRNRFFGMDKKFRVPFVYGQNVYILWLGKHEDRPRWIFAMSKLCFGIVRGGAQVNVRPLGRMLV